ncbi:hypothetical protein [Spirosoma utsteinense]|uniref:Uncharacterized protein n=1 Tax=Spirosoma utsteinense TaxID=2585773 RepID=A0ABR6VZ56_9BACT|nr:hypothetical protein [Spirosoma utsteinense]MBC3784670.1 hypothetical protein [Spirosoma utsteinense]MBC3789576.1 hypothetical protein [Spirosoma utsteinense]
MADQINKLAPLSLLNLQIGLPDDVAFYWLMLDKTEVNVFKRVNLTAFYWGRSR